MEAFGEGADDDAADAPEGEEAEELELAAGDRRLADGGLGDDAALDHEVRIARVEEADQGIGPRDPIASLDPGDVRLVRPDAPGKLSLRDAGQEAVTSEG